MTDPLLSEVELVSPQTLRDCPFAQAIEQIRSAARTLRDDPEAIERLRVAFKLVTEAECLYQDAGYHIANPRTKRTE